MLFNNGFYGQDIVMAFSPPEYCRLFAQKKAYQGGVTAPPPLATPLHCVRRRHLYDKDHSVEQLVIIASLSISCFHFCSFMRPTQLTEGSTQTFTLCQKAPANSINSIIYMTRIITSKARNSQKSGTKVFLHVENNIYRRTCWEQ